MLLQTGRKQYRIVDGSMTSCRLPKPDWQLISRSIEVAKQKATTATASSSSGTYRSSICPS
jgi:LPS-assembly protein